MSRRYLGGLMTALIDPLTYVATAPSSGQIAYTTAGTYSWTVPAGITSICVVCIGGGGSGAGLGSGGCSGGGLDLM